MSSEGILNLFPLDLRELKPGDTLSYDVFDRAGSVVWPVGTVVEYQLHIDQGGLQGLFRRAVGPELKSPQLHTVKLGSAFLGAPVEYQSARDWFYGVRSQLRKGLELICADKPYGVEIVRAVAREIAEANARNRDATLATIHLEQSGSYRITHALHNAIVAVSIATLKTARPAELHSLLCAALTHDIAMPDQDKLHREDGPLSADQWVRIKGHPLEGERRLRDVGVSDAVWLETVLQHHERMDGSGYPSRLQKGQIRAAARVLGIADAWCAMFMSKAYRAPADVDQALRELKSGADPEAATLLERTVGVYPPGTVVRLSNGETAVVLGRSEDAHRPKLMAVLRRDNTPYSRAALVDWRAPGIEIKELTRFDPWRLAGAPLENLWRLPMAAASV